MSGVVRAILVAVLIVFVAAAVWVDTTVLDAQAQTAGDPRPVELGTQTRGSAYCVPLADRGEAVRLELATVDGDARAEVSSGGDIIEELELPSLSTAVVDVAAERARCPDHGPLEWRSGRRDLHDRQHGTRQSRGCAAVPSGNGAPLVHRRVHHHLGQRR